MPLNGANVNIVHHDLSLHFHSLEFLNVNISKTVRASEKCSNMTFIEVDICHGMGPFRMLYSVTLTYILKVKFQVAILRSERWKNADIVIAIR